MKIRKSILIRNITPFNYIAFFCIFITMANATDLSKSVSQFSTELYQKCAEGATGNVILSPFSVQTAVSLAYMGAGGATADEMAKAMHYSGVSRTDVADSFASLFSAVESNPQLKIANKIYVQNEYKVKGEFNEIAGKKFRSEAENLNFSENEASANTINAWVEDKTNNRIKDLISKDSLDALTRMVLVNAIYFKGSWEHKFDVLNTKPLPFWKSETDSVDVDTMYIKKKFRYGVFEELDATAVELPYENSSLSMLILLPNTKTGLSDLESKLGSVDLGELTNRMHKQDVNVWLPKFKIEFEIELNDVLKKLGMNTMFNDNADFSDLLESAEPLKVSQVVHKAFIEVNEEGAEAAAATAVVMRLKRSLYTPEIKEFHADHPFLFVISHGSVSLFTGSLRTIPSGSVVEKHDEL